MNYSKFQKFLSGLVIFCLLFGITFRFPFINIGVFAANRDYYDLVSIIVDETTYSKISSELNRYGKDISGALENTKVVILPVPNDATDFEIASMNEALYYDGYKALANVNFESRLVGTVLVGDIPVPLVYQKNETSKSILPYVDFDSKSYIYNHETEIYEYNNSNTLGIKPEIWHGVISPNTGNPAENIQSLKDYFSKNHDFYLGEGFYDLDLNSMNGNLNEGVSGDYEPYVFYFDSKRETSAVNYSTYVGYQAYLANKEDILYNRYTREFAEKLKDEVLGYSNEEIYSLALKVDEDIDKSLIDNSNSYLENTPDIQTRYIINNAKNKFLEIFSKGSIGTLREDVYNAGRYNYGQNVNVDFIPYLITILDVVNDEILKDLNTDLEDQIDDLVKNGLSRNILLPTSYFDGSEEAQPIHKNEDYYDAPYDPKYFENYLYGKNAKYITEASECSIFRGTTKNGGQLVEANRAYNIHNIEADMKIIEDMSDNCKKYVLDGLSLEGIWGRNTPVNFDSDTMAKTGGFALKKRDLKGAIVDIFDVAGSKKIRNPSLIPSPLLCYDNNYIDSPTESVRNCFTDQNAPERSYDFDLDFYENFRLDPQDCDRKIISIDGNEVKNVKKIPGCTCVAMIVSTNEDNTQPEDICQEFIDHIWDYKPISSYVMHKSPTPEELGIQIEAMVTPNLMIDKNRYVDFIAANGEYAKIEYPYLFRLKLPNDGEITVEKIAQQLDKYLDEKSSEINRLVDKNKNVDFTLSRVEDEVGCLYPYNPWCPTRKMVDGKFQEYYGITKTLDLAPYVSTGIPENIDLKNYLKNKGTQTLEIDGIQKTLTYYDILVFAIYWNNLDSVPLKYKFIFENYLSPQTSQDNNYFLSKNRSLYEMVYLGANGEVDQMYIGLDPEYKGENPFNEIISQNQDLSTKLLGVNSSLGTVSNSGKISSDRVFKCAPPEGVPIREWLPAIMCRLEDMMPPTINVTDGNCGYSLLDMLDDDELEKYYTNLQTCNGDNNKNGINDCIEESLKKGQLILSTNSNKYHYNSHIPLKASVKGTDGNVILLANSGDVHFEIVKVEVPLDENQDLTSDNIEVIYDKNDATKNDASVLKKYLTFAEMDVRLSMGTAEYGFTVKDKEANIYLKTTISVSDYNGQNAINLDSNELKIEVRGDRLFSSMHTFKNTDTGLDIVSGLSTVVASDSVNVIFSDIDSGIETIANVINSSSIAEEKLVLKLNNLTKNGNFLSNLYPITIDLIKKSEVIDSVMIENQSDYKSLFSLSEAGEYTLKITDSADTQVFEFFTVLPANPSKFDLSLGTNTIQTSGNISTNYIIILDRFDNVVNGNLYSIKMSVEGDGVVFLDNDKKEIVTQTFEGYKVFRLKSTSVVGDNVVNALLLDENGEIILGDSEKLKTIEKFSLDIIPQSDYYVGGGKYAFKVELKDANGNIMNDFNSRVYITANTNFIGLESEYFQLINGEGIVEFNSKTVASKEILIDLQVEGLGDVVTKSISILPGKPMKMDLVLSKSKLDATGEDYSTVQVELRDVFNNLVYTDSSTNISLEISEGTSHILETTSSSQTVKEGKTSFRVYSTLFPGIGYIKVTSNPDLSLNSYTVVDESGNLEIVGVGENSVKIESYYVWNKDKINSMQYNGLYTTLLGANYGDIEQTDYLAGSLIFSPNSKALAVTSLLNNPYTYNNTFSLSTAGGMLKMFSEADLTQIIDFDVAFQNGKLYFEIYNSSLNVNIGKVAYSLPKEPTLKICEGEISSCISDDKTSVIGKYLDSDFRFYTTGGNLQLVDNEGRIYLEVQKNGTIIRKANLDFELVSATNNYLGINIRYQGALIGFLAMNFVDASLNVVREETLFNNRINSGENNISVYLSSLSYAYYTTGRGKNQRIVVYYNDPFSSSDTLNIFSKNQTYSYENFANQGSLGWRDGNKTLLSFAAGKSVGESLKDYMSFSSVNIGDPVISLKKIQKTFSDSSDLKQFDSTVGKLITNNSVKAYRVFDYNNDGLDDILVIKNNGFLQLFENKRIGNNFLDMGNLAYIADVSNYDFIKTGDFTGDGFADIFFVGNDGKPYLLNNVDKDFTRMPLADKFNLTGNVIQFEVFDMNNDGIDDVVVLDDAGTINIFYGGGTSEKPQFTKLLITDEYGVSLQNIVRKTGGLLYFDGLYQMGVTDYSYIIEENLAYFADDTTKIKESTNYDLINSYIFEQVTYSPDGHIVLEDNNIDSLLDMPDFATETTFLKSEYAEAIGIKVEKIFSDRNGGNAIAGDIIDVKISITNTSSGTINNIAYIEKADNYITLDTNSISNSKNLENKLLTNTKFLLDGFSLAANETLTINYSGTLRKLNYLYLKVGLYETDEDGDDLYGDIIVTDSNKNCSQTVDIFRSVGATKYQKGTKTPKCDTSPLPESSLESTIDADQNGIPDYIELLTQDEEARKKYGETALDEMRIDSDGDGVPDDEDDFNMYQSFTVDLGSLQDNVDQGLDDIQDFVNALSCGFNNGACISMPLNWAPLAAGSDPVVNGELQGDGLLVDEGYPIFSALTGRQMTCGYTPCCIPMVYPISSTGFMPGTTCDSTDQAGGSYGVDGQFNWFRLFISPTLTGGIGTAICFGGPAKEFGEEAIPEGYAPLFAGGNCIVLAKPVLGCSNDGSDGDASSIGHANYSSADAGNLRQYGVINGNCTVETTSRSLVVDYVEDYLKAMSGQSGVSLFGSAEGALEDHTYTNYGPLFEIEGTGTPVSVTVDSSGDFDYSDVEEIINKRVEAFPGFLMNWVTRQLEEVVNKLTDFPTLFIVLPDFSGIFDSDTDWEANNRNWLENSKLLVYDNDETTLSEGTGIKTDVTNSITSANQGIQSATTSVNSSVKQAYEFIASLPLVNIYQEPVNISFPWASTAEIDRAIESRTQTVQLRGQEIKDAKNSWSYGAACNESDPTAQKQCEEEKGLTEKFILEATALQRSLQGNIEVIKDYKKLPEKLGNLVNKKEDYLEQILCNIENIAEVFGGRIGDNGERFKAWVELFILIKAILKSWQLLADVFIDYDEECKECKNERQDSMQSEFEIISMVVPDIPIIQFPKWPDIVLDLHNIRAGLDIYLPEFHLNPRPILLPNLPALGLPDSPSFSLSLPALPILPKLEIPALPDLPSVPSVELPNLPPPPTLPKMLAEIEGILDILKLVTKAMCILKSSKFHPEWRSGDQIAFLTERSGYMSSDFLSLSLPQFSYPFIDSIQVASYVNLEFETEFIIELARQIAMPINSFNSDFTNIFNVTIESDIPGVDDVPTQIDVDINDDGTVDTNVQASKFLDIPKFAMYVLAKNLLAGPNYLEVNKNESISNQEFKVKISKDLADSDFTSDTRFDELRELWNTVNSYTYSKENNIIKDLQENNFEKFTLVKDILNTEIVKNKQLKEEISSVINTGIKKVSQNNSSVTEYSTQLQKYNEKVFEKMSNLINYDKDNSVEGEIKQMGQDLLVKVDNAFGTYSNSEKMLADADSEVETTTNIVTGGTCQNSEASGSPNSATSPYVFEGIYVIENGKSYRLFDYISELQGTETTTMIDFDNDGDDDLLYLVNGALYLKENLGVKSNDKVYLNEDPTIISPRNNKFVNGNGFIESVNNILTVVASSSVNISFSAVYDTHNYRLSLNTIIDKFLNEKNNDYTPMYRKKKIFDGIANIGNVNLTKETDLYKERRDLVHISAVGDLRGIELETYELKNIKEDINDGKVVVLSSGNNIFAGDSTATLQYTLPNSTEINALVIPKNRHIEVKSTINVVGVIGNAYIKTGGKITVSGTDIRSLMGKPLFTGTKIYYTGGLTEVREDTYIDLTYYDDSKFSLNFNHDESWELYDLGSVTAYKYSFNIPIENDFYYGKINSFKDNILSTSSSQILFAPQLQADNIVPEININNIRVPVYQKQQVDLGSLIFEDTGVTGIKDIYIDFDLTTDSDGDGNSGNDNDSSSMSNLNFIIEGDDIILEVGPFEELYDKKIGITIIDENGNKGYKEFQFSIYSPTPYIEGLEYYDLYGSLDEDLTDQPVSFYKLRGGVISKLEDVDGETYALTETGSYIFTLSEVEKGIKIEKDGNVIAVVNEHTGKISLRTSDSGYKISVLASEDGIFPLITLNDGGQVMFYETIYVKGGSKVEVVNSFNDLDTSGVYVMLSNNINYNYYQLPENISYNPGALVIYRSTKQDNPLFTIFSDGRISVLSQNYVLNYDTYEDYVLLRLIDSNFNREVAQVLLKVDSDYVVK